MEQLLVERKEYVGKLRIMLGKGIIVSLTGQRGVGKSSIVRMLMDGLRSGSDIHLININKESTDFYGIVTYKEMVAYVDEHLSSEKRNYVIVDEAQEIEEFEKGISELQSRGVCDIIVIGSNAGVLDGEFGTLPEGHLFNCQVQGLSYLEFVLFHKLHNNDTALELYLQHGGLPQLPRFGIDNQDVVDDYLMSMLNTILLKNILERGNIRNIPLLRMLIKYLGENLGKRLSARSIASALKNRGMDASPNIILGYLDYLCKSFLISRVARYNIPARKVLEYDEKFYFEDIGLRNVAVSSTHLKITDKTMENAVYKHLCRQGFKVYTGQLNKGEVDFVAERGNERIYVQVTQLLASEEDINREFGSLKSIRDNHPKYVVSMDHASGLTNIDGIRHYHLRDFLCIEQL